MRFFHIFLILVGLGRSCSRLSIVFVYTVVPAVCSKGFPDYIRHSLHQAIITQPDCNVIIASNFHDCPTMSVNVSGVQYYDTSSKYSSLRTRIFANLSVSRRFLRPPNLHDLTRKEKHSRSGFWFGAVANICSEIL